MVANVFKFKLAVIALCKGASLNALICTCMSSLYMRCSLPGRVALKHICVCAIDAGAQEGSWHAHEDVGGPLR